MDSIHNCTGLTKMRCVHDIDKYHSKTAIGHTPTMMGGATIKPAYNYYSLQPTLPITLPEFTCVNTTH